MSNYNSNTPKMRTILTVKQTAVAHDIHTKNQLRTATGLSYPKCERLWKGVGVLRLADIDILCDKIGCELTDLIKRVPVE